MSAIGLVRPTASCNAIFSPFCEEHFEPISCQIPWTDLPATWLPKERRRISKRTYPRRGYIKIFNTMIDRNKYIRQNDSNGKWYYKLYLARQSFIPWLSSREPNMVSFFLPFQIDLLHHLIDQSSWDIMYCISRIFYAKSTRSINFFPNIFFNLAYIYFMPYVFMSNFLSRLTSVRIHEYVWYFLKTSSTFKCLKSLPTKSQISVSARYGSSKNLSSTWFHGGKWHCGILIALLVWWHSWATTELGTDSLIHSASDGTLLKPMVSFLL